MMMIQGTIILASSVYVILLKLKIEYFRRIRLFTKFLGLWPREPSQCKFYLSLVCILHRIILDCIDFFKWINDLEHFLMNFVELIGYTNILLMMLILRGKSHDLQWILSRIEDDSDKSLDLTSEEQNIFRKYYNRANKFIKVITPCLIVVSFVYYVSPLAVQIKNSHSMFVYQLPHQTHLYFEIKSPWIYSIVYISQLPALLVSCLMRVASDSMLIAMTLHACGQLSILRVQINNLEKTQLKMLSKIVDKHIYIIRYIQVLKKCFQLVLFNQLIQGTISLAITGYSIVWYLKHGTYIEFATIVGYGLFTTIMLFLYSWLGQCLINENEKVHIALYNCNWLEMPYRQARLIILSLLVSQNSLNLKFNNTFVYSMNGFAEIMKTAFAYMSVLHKIV